MPSRAATLTCINGHTLNVTWTVPVGVKAGVAARTVQSVRTRCPLCANELEVFIDGRADLRTLKIRADA